MQSQVKSLLFDAYTEILSKANYKAKHKKELKILTSKQILQRLPIALTQIKEGNASEYY